MPLEHGKSQEIFEHNLKAELEAGKPKDQALAIAYKIKRGDSSESPSQIITLMMCRQLNQELKNATNRTK